MKSFAKLISALGLACSGLVGPLAHSEARLGGGELSVASGADYATEVLGQPWQWANGSAGGLLLDAGPLFHVEAASKTAEGLRLSLARPGYVSLLWAGWLHSIPVDHDGVLAANRIDASTYKLFALYAYASAPSDGAISYFNCLAQLPSCEGAIGLHLDAGWHIYLLPMGNDAQWHLPVSWSGALEGLRLDLDPHAQTTFVLGWARLVQPESGGEVELSNPTPGREASLGLASLGGEGPSVLEPVVCPEGGCSTSGAALRVDLSFLPPGRWKLGMLGSGTASQTEVDMVEPPLPEILSPNATGDLDFAKSVLDSSWDFAALAGRPVSSVIQRVNNVAGLVLGSDGLEGTNAGPVIDDPHIYLALRGHLIDPRTWHVLTVAMTYTGPFGLGGGPEGGMLLRVMWAFASSPYKYVTSAPIVWYPDRPVVTIDLDMSPSLLVDPQSPLKLGWLQGGEVSALRLDPNEDPAPRHWAIRYVSLASSWTADRFFEIRWADPGAVPGTHAALYFRPFGSTGLGVEIAKGLKEARSNAYLWDTAQVQDGSYQVLVVASGPGGTTTAVSGGPVVVRHQGRL